MRKLSLYCFFTILSHNFYTLDLIGKQKGHFTSYLKTKVFKLYINTGLTFATGFLKCFTFSISIFSTAMFVFYSQK